MTETSSDQNPKNLPAGDGANDSPGTAPAQQADAPRADGAADSTPGFNDGSGCPIHHGGKNPAQGTSNKQWWPDRLNLKVLAKNNDLVNPLDEGFDYAEAFSRLDLEAVEADLKQLLTTSQDWWPADFGNYGPFMIRMAWHSAGTYRMLDGRGGAGHGQQRFAPLNSWPDNVLLDRARRLLWPVKKKYGQALSWGDLMILAGTVAHDIMGMPTIGFGGGRTEEWEPDDDVYWGSETEWLGTDKRDGATPEDLENPLAATNMGLIYVNPEGPHGNPDPKASAQDIKVTFRRMGMTDEETVALIAGGHTFGKTHGAGPVPGNVGPEPEAAPMEQQGLGWKSSYKSGKGVDAIGGGPEVTWTYHPTRWDNEFFHILFAYEWELMESPAGAKQWRPKDGGGADMVPEADGSGKREPRMLTSDLALREDPEFREISLKFRDNQAAFTDAYSRAWFKLTHRDMGPKSRYLGAKVPAEDFIWQDPLPAPSAVQWDVAAVKAKIADAGLTVAELVTTAWAAASTHRVSDHRGGANGARLRLDPQKNWEVNNPAQLAKVLPVLEGIAAEFGASLADVIVLAGGVGIEQAAKAAGRTLEVPFTPGRVDASQEQTDIDMFAYLEPTADGFRNYQGPRAAGLPAEFLLVDKANLLGLTAAQMTVLVGGLRVIGANWDGSDLGVFTDRVGQLTTDFFVNVLALGTEWHATDEKSTQFEGQFADGHTYRGTRADLVFASNSELRAVAEVYASDDAADKFYGDFVKAWVRVMNLDRFDVK